MSTTSPPLVRTARAGDAASIAALLRALGYATSEEEARERLLRAMEQSCSRVLVAQENGALIGCLSAVLFAYFPDGSTICRITALVVAAAHRRRQAGTALLDAAARFAAENGCSGVEVTTLEGRTEAHRFYERRGFVRTSLRYFRRS